MNGEYINKNEALTAGADLSKKEKKPVYIVLNGCSYFVTLDASLHKKAALIAEYKNGVKMFPVPDIETV